jgi:hypothetical protein
MGAVIYNSNGIAHEAVTGQTADLVQYKDSSGNTLAAFEPDGTLRLENAGMVWDDLRIVPSAFDFAGSSDPELSTWRPGATGTTYRVYIFQSGDEAFFSCQIPHKYKPEGAIRAHVHWTPGKRGATEDGNTVAWKLDYSFASIHGVFPSSQTVDLTDTCEGTDDQHLMSPDILLDTTGVGISAMMLGRVYRDTGDTWTGSIAAQSPIFLEFDLHFQIDTIGSRQYNAK